MTDAEFDGPLPASLALLLGTTNAAEADAMIVELVGCALQCDRLLALFGYQHTPPRSPAVVRLLARARATQHGTRETAAGG